MNQTVVKKLFVLTCFIASAWVARAQDAHEIKVDYNKRTIAGYEAQYAVDKKLIKQTLEDRLKKVGAGSGKRSKGYRKYTKVVFSELSSRQMDIYVKVKGKRSRSTVTMLVSAGYDNFVSQASDPATASNTISFLNNLDEDAEKMKSALQRAGSEAAMKAAEKALKDAEREKKRLARKKARLDRKLAREQKNSQKAGAELEKEKMKLEEMKTRQSGAN